MISWKIYVICVQWKAWIHMENRKLLVFFEIKLSVTKAAWALLWYSPGHFFFFLPLFPQELERKHMAIEFILNASHPLYFCQCILNSLFI